MTWEARECIGNTNFLSRVIKNDETTLFHKQPSIEHLVAVKRDKSKVFVVSMYEDICTNEYGVQLLKDQDNWEKFFLHFMIFLLVVVPIGNMTYLLDGDSSFTCTWNGTLLLCYTMRTSKPTWVSWFWRIGPCLGSKGRSAALVSGVSKCAHLGHINEYLYTDPCISWRFLWVSCSRTVDKWIINYLVQLVSTSSHWPWSHWLWDSLRCYQ